MAALGKTAAITLLTGIPGSGKSLRVVDYMKKAIDAGELLYVCNFDGTLRLPHVKFEDARKWEDLPAGAVLVVDEAQDFFRARRGGEPPSYILAMERIRKMGVRLVLTTQQPDYLDTHLRGLVGLHEHLLRVDGAEESHIFRSNEVMDNVRSKKARAAHDSEKWAFPKELYGLYDSAQVHTVKKVMSSRMKRGLIMAGIAAVLLATVVFLVGRKGAAAIGHEGEGDSPETARLSAPSLASRPGQARIKEASAIEKHGNAAKEEYFAALRPRVQQLPWSAPIYDDRQAVAEPRVFCVESGDGYDADGVYRKGGLSCITEQGSRVVMQDEAARLLARWGEPYNPFKSPQVERLAVEQPDAPPTRASAARPQAVGVGGTEIEPARYGAMRETGW